MLSFYHNLNTNERKICVSFWRKKPKRMISTSNPQPMRYVATSCRWWYNLSEPVRRGLKKSTGHARGALEE
jgi:hypothetical protein